jgi:hypothetical protein
MACFSNVFMAISPLFFWGYQKQRATSFNEALNPPAILSHHGADGGSTSDLSQSEYALQAAPGELLLLIWQNTF